MAPGELHQGLLRARRRLRRDRTRGDRAGRRAGSVRRGRDPRARSHRRHGRRVPSQLTSHRTIVTLPSPFILGWRLWDPVASRSAYATRDEFMDACVPVLRAELERLREVGVDHVQIDEPWLLMLGDPAHRERYGVDDFEREIERCVTVVNALLEGFDGAADVAPSLPRALQARPRHVGRLRPDHGRAGPHPGRPARAGVRRPRSRRGSPCSRTSRTTRSSASA